MNAAIFVSGSLCQLRHEQSWYEPTFLFLLFISKECTNMAAPGGAQFWRKEKKCFISIDERTKQSLRLKAYAHFSAVSGHISFFLGVPFKLVGC